MRIIVRITNLTLGDEKRAYAEYRFFVATAQYQPDIRRLDVVVQREATDRPFRCTAVVDLGAGGRIKTHARAVTFSTAIDRAAELTGRMIRRRIGIADPKPLRNSP